MLCFTDKARQSNIKKIGELIDMLGHMTGNELNYLDYRAIVNYLNVARDAYIEEMENK